MASSGNPTLEERLQNTFILTSKLLEELQRLRLNRGSMSRNVYREKEAEIVNSLKKFVDEYKMLSEEQWHDTQS